MKKRLLWILVLPLVFLAEPASVVSFQGTLQTMTPDQATQALTDMKSANARNNERRFADMQTSAVMFEDLDEIEKTVKAIRKSAK